MTSQTGLIPAPDIARLIHLVPQSLAT
jgi:hypothetical protein